MKTQWITPEELKEIEELDTLYGVEEGERSLTDEALSRVKMIGERKENIQKQVEEYLNTYSSLSVCTLLDLTRKMVEEYLEQLEFYHHIGTSQQRRIELINKMFNMLELAKLQICLEEESGPIGDWETEIGKIKKGILP